MLQDGTSACWSLQTLSKFLLFLQVVVTNIDCGCTIAKHCFNLRPQPWYRGQKWLYSPLRSSIPTFLSCSLCLCPGRGLQTLAEPEQLLKLKACLALTDQFPWIGASLLHLLERTRFGLTPAWLRGAVSWPLTSAGTGETTACGWLTELWRTGSTQNGSMVKSSFSPGELRPPPLLQCPLRWPQPGSIWSLPDPGEAEGLSQLFNQSCGIGQADSLPVFKDSVPYFCL